jgi:2-polyprenyl-6-methoxyphenol hydroxylase-like FAD-dependent oxidoreductase
MRDLVEVLVVWAGPVGLFLACELQRLGVDYLLVEKVPERAYFCKAMAVTPRYWKSSRRLEWRRSHRRRRVAQWDDRL